MKLEKWALIAEIVSGVAVVVTLIFLILGIRENTEVVRASAYASSIDGFNDFTNIIFSDPELVRLYDAFFNDGVSELSEPDTQRLQFMMNTLFRSYEKAYFSRQYGLLGEAEWERMEVIACRNFRLTEQLPFWRENVIVTLVTREFREFLNRCPTGE